MKKVTVVIVLLVWGILLSAQVPDKKMQNNAPKISKESFKKSLTAEQIKILKDNSLSIADRRKKLKASLSIQQRAMLKDYGRSFGKKVQKGKAKGVNKKPKLKKMKEHKNGMNSGNLQRKHHRHRKQRLQ